MKLEKDRANKSVNKFFLFFYPWTAVYKTITIITRTEIYMIV